MRKVKFTLPTGLRKVGRTLSKHSPEILMAAGLVGTVGATVMACKATIKSQDIIFDLHEEIDINCPEKEVKKAKVAAYCSVAKSYAPSVTVMALSFGMIFAGNAVYRKRCAQLAAAYTTINQAYNNYRKAVREKFGVDVDRELALGARMQTIEGIDENTGKKQKQKTVVVDPDAMYSPYARFFDESSRNWEKDSVQNLDFLVRQQAYWNDYLKRHGHVYYNEVLRSLDIPETSWTNAGWVYDKSNPNIDSQIDFGIFECSRPRVRDFVNGYENVIILDFNVDGDISYCLTGNADNEFEHQPINWKRCASGKLRYIGGSGDEVGAE